MRQRRWALAGLDLNHGDLVAEVGAHRDVHQLRHHLVGAGRLCALKPLGQHLGDRADGGDRRGARHRLGIVELVAARVDHRDEVLEDRFAADLSHLARVEEVEDSVAGCLGLVANPASGGVGRGSEAVAPVVMAGVGVADLALEALGVVIEGLKGAVLLAGVMALELAAADGSPVEDHLDARLGIPVCDDELDHRRLDSLADRAEAGQALLVPGLSHGHPCARAELGR